MNTWYEIWDSDSVNPIGSYATEQDARLFLRQSLKVHGSAAFAGLVLAQETADHDEPRVIVAGAELAPFVEAAADGASQTA